MTAFTWITVPVPVGVNVSCTVAPEVTPAQAAGAAKVKVVAEVDEVTFWVAFGVITMPLRADDAVTLLLGTVVAASAIPTAWVEETPVPTLHVSAMALAVGLPG